MAKLQKIYISGIRSYGISKEDAQTMTFFAPVTLLLGQNGCGKTTVIESIKHSITGDFPTSGKTGGQMFVADPNLHGKSSILGCIKLKLQDIYGNPANISRTLRVDIINTETGQVRYKSQDASYTYFDRDGNEHTLSAKLQDCKNMIQMLVGVSESVLNNVLLCHQEDSLWPLAEDSQVKKKFDQIFDSSKYERAVDLINKSIKKYTVSVRSHEKDLIYLKDIRNSAHFKRSMLQEKKHSLENMIKDAEEMKSRSVSVKSRLIEVIALEEGISKLQNLISDYTSQLVNNQKYQNDLKELVTNVFEGTDEELDYDIKHFHIVLKQKQEELQQVDTEISQLLTCLKGNNQEEQVLRSHSAGLQEQIRVYRFKINERDNNVNILLEKYNINPEKTFESNYENISRAVKVENQSLLTAETELEESERLAQEEVDSTKAKYMEIHNFEILKNQEMHGALNDRRNIDSKLEDLSASDIEFQNIETKIERIGHEIHQIEATLNADTAAKTMEKNKNKVRELTNTLQDLDQDIADFMHNAMVEKEMEHYQSDKIIKEKEIRVMKNKHYNDFQHVFGNIIPTADIKSEIDHIRIKYSKILQTQQREYSDKEKLSSNINAKLSVFRSELDCLKRELRNGRQAIEKYCKIEEFEGKIKDVGEANRDLQTEKGQLAALKIIYKKYMKDLNEKKCCPVCDTNFASREHTLNKLIKDMNGRVENIPSSLGSVTARLERGEKLYSELTQLKPIYMKITKMENDLKEKGNAVYTIESEYSSVQKALKELNTGIEKDRITLELCGQLGSVAAIMDKYSIDIARNISQITELKEKLIAIGSNRSKVDTVTLIHDTKEEIVKLNEENDRIGKRITTNQTRLYNCRTQKSDLVEEQLKWQRLVQEKPQLLVRQKELAKKIEQLQEVIESSENDTLAALTVMEEAKVKLNTVKNNNIKALDDLRKRSYKNINELKDIEKLVTEIKTSKGEQLEESFQNIGEKITSVQDKRKEIEQEQRKLQVQRDLLKDELRDQDTHEKSLHNNKKIRELVKVEINLKKKIDAVTQEIASQNYYTIEKEKLTLQHEYSNFLTKIANIDGQVKSLQSNITDINTELASYTTDPDKMYIEKLFDIHFDKMAIKKLRQTHDCLSVAICKYHREQLMSINQQLRDLWRSIYQGNDIDYIQIESGETQLGTSRRQYSYCVMQIKGGTKMPLRNKCSAGQKVLSCLLVRMSLALHFSAKCGIFALDEPTTNLDRENIRSLSQAIAKLITRRHKAEGNFQFLIITHDSEFLNALREEDAIREYYRVSRNFKGNSVITLEVI